MKEENLKFFYYEFMFFGTHVSALDLRLTFLVICNNGLPVLSLLSILMASSFSCLQYLRISSPHTSLTLRN